MKDIKEKFLGYIESNNLPETELYFDQLVKKTELYLDQVFKKYNKPIIQIDILVFKSILAKLDNDIDKQITFYEKIIELLKSDITLEKDVDDSFSIMSINVAQYYLNEQKITEAENVLNKVNSKFYDVIKYLSIKTAIYIEQKNFQNALELIKIIEKEHPLNEHGIYLRAMVYYDCRMLDEALKTISLLKNLNSSDKHLYIDILLDLNKTDKAREVIKTIPLKELTIEDYLKYGKIYFIRENYELAKLFFNKAIELPYAIIFLAQTNMAQSNFKEAKIFLNDAKLINFDDKNLDMTKFLCNYLLNNNFPAIKELKKIRNKYGNHVDIDILEMDILASKREFDKAIEVGINSINIDKSNSKIFTRLIQCYLKLNKLEEANKYCEQAFSLGVTDPFLKKLYDRINLQKKQSALIIIENNNVKLEEPYTEHLIPIKTGKEELKPISDEEIFDEEKIRGEWTALTKQEKDRSYEKILKRRIEEKKAKEKLVLKSDFEILRDKARPWGMNYPSIMDPEIHPQTKRGQNRTEEKEYGYIDRDSINLNKEILDAFEEQLKKGYIVSHEYNESGIKGNRLKIIGSYDKIRLYADIIIGANGEKLYIFNSYKDKNEEKRAGIYLKSNIEKIFNSHKPEICIS